MRNFTFKLLFFLLGSLPLMVSGQAGTNDATFNFKDDGSFGNGSGFNGAVKTTITQPDGKIISGGEFTNFNGTACNRIIRLFSNGVIDPTFGIGSGANSFVNAIQLQSDGKIIVGGDFTSYNGISVSRLVRLDADGTIDPTFVVGTGLDLSVKTISIDAVGKILIGGDFTSYNGTSINRVARINQDGSLDATFNSGSGLNGSANSISLQADGKIIIGGSFTSVNGTTRNRIARLNIDGTVDSSLDPGTGFNNPVNTVSVQSDGKLIIGGSYTSFNGTTYNRIARLNSDGTLDNTFVIGTGLNNTVWTTAVKPDGKILIGGVFSTFNGNSRSRILCLNTDGSIDNTFVIGSGFTGGVVNSIFLQSNNTILLGGSFTTYNGTSRSRIACLNADGSWVSSFNPGTGFDLKVTTSAIQTDGKIILGGAFSSFNGTPRNSIVRLNSNGNIDSTFNPGSGFKDLWINATAIQSDGKILVGGYFTTFNGSQMNYFARLNPDGSLDQTFNQGKGFNNNVFSIAVQADDKIVVGGQFTSYDDSTRNRILRLNTDGTLDETFQPGIGFDANVKAISIQTDGKIVLGGEFTTYKNSPNYFICRLNDDGTKDNTFNIGSGFNGPVNTLMIQADDKIVVGGDFLTYNGTNRNYIARLNTTGSLDNSFNPSTGFNGQVYSLSLDNNGKIIAGGQFTSLNGNPSNYIARMNTDGTSDNSFSPTSGFNNAVYTTSIQSDGKIIAGGEFTTYNNSPRNRVARIFVNCVSVGRDSILSCSPITWIDGNTYSSSNSNAAAFILTSPVNGCDSLVTLNLTIAPTKTSTTNSTICYAQLPYSWNGLTFSAAGTQTATLATVYGCDSLVTLNLNVIIPDTTYETISACDSYTWNGNTYTASGTYSVQLTNTAGCDSIANLNLTLGITPQNTLVSISTNSILITPAQNGANYQWITCPNNNPINGEVNDSLIPTSNGFYAVIVSNSCGTDTSQCIEVKGLSINEKIDDYYSLYPNPALSEITLNVPEAFIGSRYYILDNSGRILIQGTINTNKESLNIEKLSNGNYILKLSNSNTTSKFVKF